MLSGVTCAPKSLYDRFVEGIQENKRSKLSLEVESDEHVRRLAKHMIGWEAKADLFELSRTDVKDIQKGHYKDQPELQR